ncbi:MAG: bile acid:sodium symporter [Bacteroidales bacterium]|nr:bile acid:sodium symporter [Bacteroidales bacterium]
MRKIGIDGFVVALICAVLVAWAYPALGVMTSPVSLGLITDVGIAGIFFFYGLRINPAQMRVGVLNWKLHILIQLTTFVLFPILIFSAMLFVPEAKSSLLWVGIFYVAALPSTVSSSVLMVSIGRGNIPAAIFNASLSSILGVLLTPLWMRFFLTQATHGGIASFNDILLRLLWQIVLPLTVGFLLHRILSNFAEKYKNYLRLFEKTVIVLIVYTAFSRSFAEGIFLDYSLWTIFGVAFGMLLLFTVIYWTLKLICKLLRFSLEDSITALFCGSKKSLVHGSAMAKVLFQNIASSGLLLMPIMMYHILQLIIVGVIAVKLSGRK